MPFNRFTGVTRSRVQIRARLCRLLNFAESRVRLGEHGAKKQDCLVGSWEQAPKQPTFPEVPNEHSLQAKSSSFCGKSTGPESQGCGPS